MLAFVAKLKLSCFNSCYCAELRGKSATTLFASLNYLSYLLLLEVSRWRMFARLKANGILVIHAIEK